MGIGAFVYTIQTTPETGVEKMLFIRLNGNEWNYIIPI